LAEAEARKAFFMSELPIQGAASETLRRQAQAWWLEAVTKAGLDLTGFDPEVPLAQRLAKILGRIEKAQVPVGTLDITLYRDDLSTVGHRPEVKKSTMEFDIQDKDIVLVDDVIYTGRTTRAALDALFDHGRPRRIQMCVLIDRGHRELPVEASFVGRTIQTTPNESIEVKLSESDGADKVLLMERIPEEK